MSTKKIPEERACCICKESFLTVYTKKLCCSQTCNKIKWYKDKGTEYFRARYSENPERYKKANRKRNKYQKDKCFEGYGGYICQCCGVTGEKFCTLDHVNNDGNNHRKDLGIGHRTSSIYKWAIDNNFPKTLQVLCWNCNCAKNINGGICPHKETTNGNS